MRSVPEKWSTPSPESWYGRFLARHTRHPDEFDCAVRVVAGELPGESGRWRYRRSAIDPLTPEWDVVTLTHGTVVLRLCFTGETVRSQPSAFGGVRPMHQVWPAIEVTTGATVEVAVDPAEADRLHLDV